MSIRPCWTAVSDLGREHKRMSAPERRKGAPAREAGVPSWLLSLQAAEAREPLTPCGCRCELPRSRVSLALRKTGPRGSRCTHMCGVQPTLQLAAKSERMPRGVRRSGTVEWLQKPCHCQRMRHQNNNKLAWLHPEIEVVDDESRIIALAQYVQ